jgi:hypothetical protein
MPQNAEAHYRQLNLLISQMPPLQGRGEYSQEQMQWLGRASVLIEGAGDMLDTAAMRHHMSLINTAGRSIHVKDILVILHRALARAEQQVPVAAQGAFIHAGETFSAFQAVAKVLSSAQEGILLIDPYLSTEAVFDFALTAPENVTVRLLLDGQRQALNEGLRAGVARWQQQYGQSRPLSARCTAPRQLHDRLILLDNREAWVLTQSFKDLAERAHASLVRADDELAEAKVAAYNAMWQAATAL